MRAARSGSWLVWLDGGFYITEIVRPNVDTPEFSRNRDNDPIMSNTCETRINHNNKRARTQKRSCRCSSSPRSFVNVVLIILPCWMFPTWDYHLLRVGLIMMNVRKRAHFQCHQEAYHRRTVSDARPFYWAKELDTANVTPLQKRSSLDVYLLEGRHGLHLYCIK